MTGEATWQETVGPDGEVRVRAGTAPIAVCVSGRGSNLVALRRAERRGSLCARIVLVLADQPCPAVEWAAGEGIPVAVVSPDDHRDRAAWDRAVADALVASGGHAVVLAGFMRVVGPAVLGAFGGRILNVHPSLLPAFPGAHAVRDALAAGVRETGVTVHLVDETLDGGPIVFQQSVPVLPDDDEERLLERLHGVEHRLLPNATALFVAGALRVEGRRVVVDQARAAAVPAPRRALLSVSDRTNLVDLGRGLSDVGFELVSTGGTARALRDAGLDVTDVSAVTGFPEMLDGRVKTLHPRVSAGVLADVRRDDHRAQLAALAIDPFELVVVNLYPFARAAREPGIGVDELIEQIDIGGPSLVRAAAKNHASVAVVTDPTAYLSVVDELRTTGRVGDETRRRLAVEAFRHTADYDARIAEVLPERLGLSATDLALREAEREEGEAPVAISPFPIHLDLSLERVQLLRYGENPHQSAALYRMPGADPASGPFATGVDLRQGKPLSYNNLLDASAAAGVARDLRGAGCAIVKHTNPCGVCETDDIVAAWDRAFDCDRDSAFGGVVAVNQPIGPALAERLVSIFLEVVVAPAIDDAALAILARRPNLRVVVDPWLTQRPARNEVEYRTAGGGVLATESDVMPDDPAAWRLATTRSATERELADLGLAWRIVRHVKSNGIVLVKDGAIAGIGAGQMSRVDAARIAVDKAGPERVRGAVCASDAFYPFPDGVQVCADAGVTAFVQPGGSLRDGEVIAAAEAAGATMLLTGVRHFRH